MTQGRKRERSRAIVTGAIALATGAMLATCALAQQTVSTIPAPATSLGGNASGTIAVTGVFQKVFSGAANSLAPSVGSPGTRHGCTVENNGTHSMYVTEALGIAASTATNSAVVAAGSAYYCTNVGGTVLTGEIDITGTSGDAFYAAQY